MQRIIKSIILGSTLASSLVQAGVETIPTTPSTWGSGVLKSGNVVRRSGVVAFVHPATGYLSGQEWAPRYYHIKTPSKLKGADMWRYDLKGYSYGNAVPLDMTWVGYFYEGFNDMNNNKAVNRNPDQTWLNVSQYVSTDGYLVLKFGPLNQYYNSFVVDYQSGSTGDASNHARKNYSVTLTADDIKL